MASGTSNYAPLDEQKETESRVAASMANQPLKKTVPPENTATKADFFTDDRIPVIAVTRLILISYSDISVRNDKMVIRSGAGRHKTLSPLRRDGGFPGRELISEVDKGTHSTAFAGAENAVLCHNLLRKQLVVTQKFPDCCCLIKILTVFEGKVFATSFNA